MLEGDFYIYGDEPWLGDYGTSAGNVGWSKDRLFHYEGELDPAKYAVHATFCYEELLQ